MYKLILGFTLLSIIFTSLPIIGAMVYIITEFSTGNIVWIMALDSLIVTTLVLLLSIFNILAVNTVITQDAKRVNLISVSIGPPQF